MACLFLSVSVCVCVSVRACVRAFVCVCVVCYFREYRLYFCEHRQYILRAHWVKIKKVTKITFIDLDICHRMAPCGCCICVTLDHHFQGKTSNMLISQKWWKLGQKCKLALGTWYFNFVLVFIICKWLLTCSCRCPPLVRHPPSSCSHCSCYLLTLFTLSICLISESHLDVVVDLRPRRCYHLPCPSSLFVSGSWPDTGSWWTVSGSSLDTRSYWLVKLVIVIRYWSVRWTLIRLLSFFLAFF